MCFAYNRFFDVFLSISFFTLSLQFLKSFFFVSCFELGEIKLFVLNSPRFRPDCGTNCPALLRKRPAKSSAMWDALHVRHGILIRRECWPTAKRPQRFLNTRRKCLASVPSSHGSWGWSLALVVMHKSRGRDGERGRGKMEDANDMILSFWCPEVI